MTASTTPASEVTWAVFTKPWQTLDGVSTGRLLTELGFTGAEIPVRPTAFVTPVHAQAVLPGSRASWPTTGS